MASRHLVRVAYIGASVCAQGYLDHAVALSGGALARVANAGISGNNFSQVIARFDADVAAYKPDEVWLPMDPYINESTTTLDDAKKNSVATLINKTIAIGARPVVFGTNLKGSTELQISVFNTWVKGYCSLRGVEYVELWDNLLVQATGVLDTAKMDGIQTHPLWDERVKAGAQYAAMRFQSIGTSGYRRGASYLRTVGAAGQNTQVNDPFNTSGTASQGGRWASGTLNNGTITYSKVATALPDIGVWQRMDVSLGAVSGAYAGASVNAPGMAHVEGEEWYITFRLRTTNMSNLSIDAYIDWQNNVGGSLAGRKSWQPAIIGNMDGLVSYILPAPANAWKAQLSFKFTQITNAVAAAGLVDVAMIGIGKLTPS